MWKFTKPLLFAICGLAHLRNLWMAIAEWAQEFANLRFADKQKDLRAHLLLLDTFLFISDKSNWFCSKVNWLSSHLTIFEKCWARTQFAVILCRHSRPGTPTSVNVKGTQAWNFFLYFFCRNRNLMVSRACNTRFLKIVFDSAEIFNF